jgi:hypothetical protein
MPAAVSLAGRNRLGCAFKLTIAAPVEQEPVCVAPVPSAKSVAGSVFLLAIET